MELLENARRARKGATSAAQDLEAATGSLAAPDGPVALDKAAAGENLADGRANGAAAEKEDPQKSCWLCHASEHAVQLRVCSGCHKVRLFTAKFTLIEAEQMCSVSLILLLPHLWSFFRRATAVRSARRRTGQTTRTSAGGGTRRGRRRQRRRGGRRRQGRRRARRTTTRRRSM